MEAPSSGLLWAVNRCRVSLCGKEKGYFGLHQIPRRRARSEGAGPPLYI